MNHSLDTLLSVRPTRRRLLVALGIASALVAAVLASLAALRMDVATPRVDDAAKLTIRIEGHPAEPGPEPGNLGPAEPPAAPVESLASASAPAENPQPEREIRSIDVTPPAAESKPAPDWHLIAKSVVKQQLDDEYRQNAARAALWRQTPSVMFKPGDKAPIKEPEPLLANIRFRPEVHVFGLGITIGSCFIGIPLLGIPVDERTAGPTLFYCARGSR